MGALHRMCCHGSRLVKPCNGRQRLGRSLAVKPLACAVVPTSSPSQEAYPNPMLKTFSRIPIEWYQEWSDVFRGWKRVLRERRQCVLQWGLSQPQEWRRMGVVVRSEVSE